MVELLKRFEKPSERNSAMLFGCTVSFIINIALFLIAFFLMAELYRKSVIIAEAMWIVPVLFNIIVLVVLFKKRLKYVAFGQLLMILVTILVFGVCFSTLLYH
jgi:hypothetical protein